MLPRISLAVTCACAALVTAACGAEDTSDTEPESGVIQVEVTAADLAFSPTSIPADAGKEIEVTLVNQDDVEHSFTIDDLVDVEAHGGDEASDTFTAPDSTVEFYCRYHPDQMRGEVSIAGSSDADTGGGGMMDDQDLDY